MYVMYNGTDPFENYDLEELMQIEDIFYEKLFLNFNEFEYRIFINNIFYLDKENEQDTLTIFNSEIDIVNKYLEKYLNFQSDINLKNTLSSIIKNLKITKIEHKDFYILYSSSNDFQ